MPFLGKDWRSYGETWVKTEEGWERVKVLECILDHIKNELDRTCKNNNAKKLRSSSSLSSTTSSCESSTTTTTATLTRRTQRNSETIESDDDVEEEEEEEDEYYLDDNANNNGEEDGDEDLRRLSLNSNSSQCSVDSIGMSSSSSRSSSSDTSVTSSQYIRQPHVFLNNGNYGTNRENNAPKMTVSEILNGLDMVGAVKDIRRFNYVCKLVQLIINEKLGQISGNAQRTLFMIVRVMVYQVIKTHENVNIMKKLLFDFKKKLQDSYYYYFYYIGSQKLWEKHLNTINKWQFMIEQTPFVPLHPAAAGVGALRAKQQQQQQQDQTTNCSLNLINLPNDCKVEIMRRLNTGLDLVNISKCNKSLYDIVSKEISIWKNLCLYHFQQSNINAMLKRTTTNGDRNSANITNYDDFDWKMLYFRLKRRYGHREVYTDMIHKCTYCKCLFWKEIGHPCAFESSEPITPKKLINLLLM